MNLDDSDKPQERRRSNVRSFRASWRLTLSDLRTLSNEVQNQELWDFWRTHQQTLPLPARLEQAASQEHRYREEGELDEKVIEDFYRLEIIETEKKALDTIINSIHIIRHKDKKTPQELEKAIQALDGINNRLPAENKINPDDVELDDVAQYASYAQWVADYLIRQEESKPLDAQLEIIRTGIAELHQRRTAALDQLVTTLTECAQSKYAVEDIDKAAQEEKRKQEYERMQAAIASRIEVREKELGAPVSIEEQEQITQELSAVMRKNLASSPASLAESKLTGAKARAELLIEDLKAISTSWIASVRKLSKRLEKAQAELREPKEQDPPENEDDLDGDLIKLAKFGVEAITIHRKWRGALLTRWDNQLASHETLMKELDELSDPTLLTIDKLLVQRARNEAHGQLLVELYGSRGLEDTDDNSAVPYRYHGEFDREEDIGNVLRSFRKELFDLSEAGSNSNTSGVSSDWETIRNTLRDHESHEELWEQRAHELDFQQISSLLSSDQVDCQIRRLVRHLMRADMKDLDERRMQLEIEQIDLPNTAENRPLIERLDQQISDVETDRKRLLNRWGENHKETKEEIAGMRALIASRKNHLTRLASIIEQALLMEDWGPDLRNTAEGKRMLTNLELALMLLRQKAARDVREELSQWEKCADGLITREDVRAILSEQARRDAVTQARADVERGTDDLDQGWNKMQEESRRLTEEVTLEANRRELNNLKIWWWKRLFVMQRRESTLEADLSVARTTLQALQNDGNSPQIWNTEQQIEHLSTIRNVERRRIELLEGYLRQEADLQSTRQAYEANKYEASDEINGLGEILFAMKSLQRGSSDVIGRWRGEDELINAANQFIVGIQQLRALSQNNNSDLGALRNGITDFQRDLATLNSETPIQLSRLQADQQTIILQLSVLEILEAEQRREVLVPPLQEWEHELQRMRNQLDDQVLTQEANLEEWRVLSNVVNGALRDLGAGMIEAQRSMSLNRIVDFEQLIAYLAENQNLYQQELARLDGEELQRLRSRQQRLRERQDQLQEGVNGLQTELSHIEQVGRPEDIALITLRDRLQDVHNALGNIHIPAIRVLERRQMDRMDTAMIRQEDELADIGAMLRGREDSTEMSQQEEQPTLAEILEIEQVLSAIEMSLHENKGQLTENRERVEEEFRDDAEDIDHSITQLMREMLKPVDAVEVERDSNSNMPELRKMRSQLIEIFRSPWKEENPRKTLSDAQESATRIRHNLASLEQSRPASDRQAESDADRSDAQHGRLLQEAEQVVVSHLERLLMLPTHFFANASQPGKWADAFYSIRDEIIEINNEPSTPATRARLNDIENEVETRVEQLTPQLVSMEAATRKVEAAKLWINKKRAQIAELSALRMMGDPTLRRIETAVDEMAQHILRSRRQEHGVIDATTSTQPLDQAAPSLRELYREIENELDVQLRNRETIIRSRLAAVGVDFQTLRMAEPLDRVLGPIAAMPDQRMVIYRARPATNSSTQEDQFLVVTEAQLNAVGRQYETEAGHVNTANHPGFQIREPQAQRESLSLERPSGLHQWGDSNPFAWRLSGGSTGTATNDGDLPPRPPGRAGRL